MNCPNEFGIEPTSLVHLTVRSAVPRVRAVEEEILRQVELQTYPEEAVFAIRLALEEALVNAIRHGNRSDPQKNISIYYYIGADRCVIGVRDEGKGFNPSSLPDPTLDENLEKPHGRGVMLMRAYMTKVCYCTQGNEVWLLKRVER